MQPRKSSSRPARPTRFSATRTSAPPTTAMDTPAWWQGGIWRRPFAGGVDIGDIFGDLFRRDVQCGRLAQRGSRQQRGDDLRFDLAIDFEACHLRRLKPRSRFAASRPAAPAMDAAAPRDAAPPSAANARAEDRSAINKASSQWPAPAAPAEAPAQVIGDPCQTAVARHASPSELKLNVKVPPGVEEGTRIRYSGEGDAGRSAGPKGDLYVVLSIRPHDFFEREGTTCIASFPSAFRRPRWARRSRFPRIDGHVTSRFPRARRTARVARTRQRRSVPQRTGPWRPDCEGAGADSRKLSRTPARIGYKLAESLTVDNKPTSPSLIEKMKDLFT